MHLLIGAFTARTLWLADATGQAQAHVTPLRLTLCALRPYTVPLATPRSSAFGGHHDDGCSVASGSSQAASGLGLGLWGSGTASVTASADLSHAVMAASAGGAAAHALHPSAGGGESAATQGPFKAQKKKGVFGRIKRALSGRGSTAEVVPVPAAMVVAAPLAAGAGAEPMGRPPRPV